MKQSIFIQLLAVCMLLPMAAAAQSTAKNNYEQKAIRLCSPNLYKYSINGESKRMGGFFQKLQKEFENASEEAKKEMHLAVKKGKIASAFSGGGLVLILGGALSMATLPEITALAIMSGGTALLIPTIFIGTASQRHMYNAVWLYNRDVLE
jgi:hypothetical protein